MSIAILQTGGLGAWSTDRSAVSIDRIDMLYQGGKKAELVAYFDASTWDTEKHGLIYTDPQFIAEMRSYLKHIGFSENVANSLEYTEHGMQGSDYVSFDIDMAALGEATEAPRQWLGDVNVAITVAGGSL